MATILEKSGFNPDKKLKIVGTSPVKHDGIDKVTGRAKFGADLYLPGMLVGKILRSPHPHARIKSIDISAAEKLPGVKAVVTRDDFPEIKAGTPDGDMTRNAMAREKALYDGHPVAAVAATSESIAKAALKLIKVEYEPLPHVIDPVQAMAPTAPILHEHVRTKGIKVADQPTNVIERLDLAMGDAEAGFKEADVIVEHEYDTKPMHQGYIEPQGCVASCTEDGQIELWCCTQAPWVFRDRLSNILKIESAKIRVQQSEMGGGFGGKTGFYGEPVAIQLARKAKRPVKIALTRNEVFRATGPVSGTKSRIKIGAKKDGTITAADAELIFQTGAFTGSMFINAPQAMFTRYNLKNVKTVSYEVVSNRPKVNSFRAPCVPQVVFGVDVVADQAHRRQVAHGDAAHRPDLAGEVEDPGAGRKPAGVDLRDARPTGHILPQVEVEGPGGYQIESLDGGDADLHHSRLVDCLGEPGRRGDSARCPPDDEVGEPLAGLDDHQLALIPQALGEEIPTGKVLGESEVRHRDTAHLGPVADPPASLLRGYHGSRARRPRPAARPTPQGPAAESLERAFDVPKFRDRACSRRRYLS